MSFLRPCCASALRWAARCPPARLRAASSSRKGSVFGVSGTTAEKLRQVVAGRPDLRKRIMEINNMLREATLPGQSEEYRADVARRVDEALQGDADLREAYKKFNAILGEEKERHEQHIASEVDPNDPLDPGRAIRMGREAIAERRPLPRLLRRPATDETSMPADAFAEMTLAKKSLQRFLSPASSSSVPSGDEIEHSLVTLEKLAAKNFVPAQRDFGVAVLNDRFPLPKQFTSAEKRMEALRYLQRASRADDREAALLAGRLYLDGTAMAVRAAACSPGADLLEPHARKLAFQHFVRAADAGSREAAAVVARMFQNGDGTDRNIKLAADFAYRSGDTPRAQYLLSEILADEDQYAMDEAINEATSRYICGEMALSADPVEARVGLVGLGMYYLHEGDFDDAVKQFTAAAEQGNRTAKAFVDELRSGGAIHRVHSIPPEDAAELLYTDDNVAVGLEQAMDKVIAAAREDPDIRALFKKITTEDPSRLFLSPEELDRVRLNEHIAAGARARDIILGRTKAGADARFHMMRAIDSSKDTPTFVHPLVALLGDDLEPWFHSQAKVPQLWEKSDEDFEREDAEERKSVFGRVRRATRRFFSAKYPWPLQREPVLHSSWEDGIWIVRSEDDIARFEREAQHPVLEWPFCWSWDVWRRYRLWTESWDNVPVRDYGSRACVNETER